MKTEKQKRAGRADAGARVIPAVSGIPVFRLLGLAVLMMLPLPEGRAETLGGGTIASPAVGPAPSYGIGGDGFVLVKNWNFGTSADSTIKNMADMNAHFFYHDQFNNTIGGGGDYGARIVASDAANALSGQPVEGTNTGGQKVREFFTDSLRTYLVPLNGATTVTATSHNAGSGSFMAKWELPKGGAQLNQDMIWETRVRYVPPKYFWYSHWIAGNIWYNTEVDVIESYGYDNGGGATNYDGRFWHSEISAGEAPNTNTREVNYGSWVNGMSAVGVPMPYDASQYHTWTLLYRKNNRISIYVDGREVQRGNLNWTQHGQEGTPSIDMSFLFDATWGHTKISGVNKSMPASEFIGKYFEFDYSRVYLRDTGINRGPGSSISVSSDALGWWQKSNLVDARVDTISPYYGWSSKNTDTVNHAEWAKVAMPAAQPVNQIILIPRNDGVNAGYGFPVDFTIETSPDNVNWSTAVTRTAFPRPSGNAGQAFVFPWTSARYVKVNGTSLRANPNDGNKYKMQLNEVEIYQLGNQLFKQKPVTVSSDAGGWWQVKNLIDGVQGSLPTYLGWSGNLTDTVNHTEWAQVDMRISFPIDTVILYPRNDGANTGQGFPLDFTIQVSNDGVNWTSVVTRTNYPLPGNAGQAFMFPAVSARFIKVNATGLRPNPADSNKYKLQLAEIEAF